MPSDCSSPLTGAAAGAVDSADSLEARCLALRLIGCLAPLAADVAHVQELVVRAAMEAEGPQELRHAPLAANVLCHVSPLPLSPFCPSLSASSRQVPFHLSSHRKICTALLALPPSSVFPLLASSSIPHFPLFLFYPFSPPSLSPFLFPPSLHCSPHPTPPP
ncbi:unnamed protein product [Closterium sp. Naga37s-1]|nr:unnamed protein product [Closterium sp. Naga37s-1]